MESSGPDVSARDELMDEIVAEEERVLVRVARVLADRKVRAAPTGASYDQQLLSLRDQIAEARLEDIPPLVEEMERLQMVAARRAEVVENAIDMRSPYFGRLVLQEGDRKREVLIGRGTYVDSRTGVRIVDWRDAPVSRLYYRYDEGDQYEETFGGKLVEGEVISRRSLVITNGQLRRIGTPDGTFVRDVEGRWRRLAASAAHLSGGQGAAMRPEQHHRPGRLGVGADDGGREDRFLPEITALIDSRQFELIARPTSGLVVIQGGAGSGKTTIGLHRLAYLAYQDSRRFRSDKMLVVVFNDALARYISRVLPALGVGGVHVTTYSKWASKLRTSHLKAVPEGYTEETPSAAIKMKKHPAMLRIIDAHVSGIDARLGAAIEEIATTVPGGDGVRAAWAEAASLPIGQRVAHMTHWAAGEGIAVGPKHAVERFVREHKAEATDVVAAWADVLTDRAALGAGFAEHAPGALTEGDLDSAYRWCVVRCGETMLPPPEGPEAGDERNAASERAEVVERRAIRDAAERDELSRELDTPSSAPASASERGEEDGDDEGPADDRGVGVDGRAVDEDLPALDHEDDALLLRLVQRMRGPLRRGREALVYEHVFIDEAQDLSPVELAVVLDTVSKEQSVTLAGDTAQRLLMDNGFTDWRGVLHDLGMEHVEVEPLRVAYRSTAEILDIAHEALGPLAPAEKGVATRTGAPVELLRFGQAGEAVGALAEALRELLQSEPRASVAVIARYPEQADLYYLGLEHAEVPNLRRIAEQDFPFKAGVDVTDARQVKGLEFDYVVLVEVSEASFPEEDEARHLLHIAMTRAAHQLWVTTTGEPSRLLPPALRARGY